MLSSLDGTIRHRLLVSYAADPEVVAAQLPAGLRPQLVRGRAVVGICLLRLADLRPTGLPAWMGVTTDNAAHRVAVEWDSEHGPAIGVHVLRRDTGNRLSRWVGGRAFPGVHGPARVRVDSSPELLRIEQHTPDGADVFVRAAPIEAAAWVSPLFGDVPTASAFYERGSVGWSVGRDDQLEGVEMSTTAWQIEPVEIEVRSELYDDLVRFPPGSLALDGALLMRDVPVRWRQLRAARPVFQPRPAWSQKS